jgi:hypothetical protein
MKTDEALRLEFRLKARDERPQPSAAGIREALEPVPGIEALVISDPNQNDALFMTVLVRMQDGELPSLSALRTALLALDEVDVFVVDGQVKLHALQGLTPEAMVQARAAKSHW